MAHDTKLHRNALDVLTHADRHHWIHQTTWFGEPVLNLPQDMFALQEIIFRTRPRYVVEVGVAWGGSLLFNACLLEVLDGNEVIGIDIFIPDDLRQRLGAHGKLSRRIRLMEGSSIDENTIESVRNVIGDGQDVLVVLDSHHTHEHVLAELQVYSTLVGPGHYIVCGDTVVEHLPVQTHRPRPWGPGNNPKTALDAFLAQNADFEVDVDLDNKLLLTCNPGGYLRRKAG